MKTLTHVTGALALAAAIIYTVIRMRRAPRYPARAIPSRRQLPGLENLPPQDTNGELRVAQNSPL